LTNTTKKSTLIVEEFEGVNSLELLPAQVVISILLFLILFFGIGFLLNMLLKTTWLPGAIVYPFIVILMVNDLAFSKFIMQPIQGLINLGVRFTELVFLDYIILSAGLLGALLSGITIQMLRTRGYRMF
jgi:hypothetical protein